MQAAARLLKLGTDWPNQAGIHIRSKGAAPPNWFAGRHPFPAEILAATTRDIPSPKSLK